MNGSSRKTIRRTRRRGAALVEAAVVMPVLIMFFGLLTFFYAAYSTKQEVMVTSRSGAFAKALVGGCAGSSRPFPVKPGVPNEQGVGSVAEKSQLNSTVSEGVFTTTGRAEKDASNASLSVLGWTKHVTATSYVYCSPPTGLEVIIEALKAGFYALKGALGA